MTTKVTRNQKRRAPKNKDPKNDPRFASARTWDWRLCLDCDTLVSERCPRCGGTHYTKRPGAIIRSGIRQFGFPPSLVRR
jgi:hypothetical protein